MKRALSASVSILVTLTVLLGHRQLLKPVALTTRDHNDFYLRVEQYQQELKAGHWPLNLPDAMRGGGHAFPLFYPPLSHATALAAYSLTGDVVSATHLAGIASIMFAGLACFLVLQSLTGKTLPAALAGVVYTILPYPYVALDVRGAFAETWAFAFYPVVLLGLIRSLNAGNPPKWLPLTIAGLLTSHLVMTAWALPLLVLISLFAVHNRLSWSAVLRTGLACLLGLGLVAPFIIPALIEVSRVRAADPALVWATPEAVASVSWAFYEPIFRSSPAWTVFDAGLLGLGILGSVQSWRDPNQTRRLCWGGLVAYGLLALLSRAPLGVWRLVPQSLRYIQFPDRLLGPASFCFVMALAIAISWLTDRRSRWLLATLGLLIVLYGWRLGSFVLPRSGETGAEVLTHLADSYPDRGLTVVGEYLPRDAEPESLASAIQETKDHVGQAPLLNWNRAPDRFLAEIALPAAAEVPLPLVAYDFYQVKSGGRLVRTGSRAGQLTALLEPGDHSLTITRRWPTSLKVGMTVGLMSWLIFAGSFRRRPVTR